MPEILTYADQGFSFPILSVIVFLPVAGAIALLFVRRDEAVRQIALAVTGIDFLLSLALLPKFITGRHVVQFVERARWIESLGVDFYFGLDGISFLLFLLTTFLGWIVILSSWTGVSERVKEYHIFFLLLQAGMLGTFCCLDIFLFYVFWEIMLVPMYFIIGVWGGPRKLYAAIKFFLYTLTGSVLMLLAILYLYFAYHTQTGEWTFELHKYYGLDVPIGPQRLLFLAFFVAFAIKVPMFPFHTWLPDAHVQAPTAGSVILAGVLLKMGTYGFLRFSLPLFPEATLWFVPYGIALAVIGIIYGALTAMMQKDMKKLVAYSSVSHLGFVMLGIFALNYQGIGGGMLQMINHGLSTGALFLIVGLVYEQRHTRLIADYGGLSKVMPVFAVCFTIIMLSSIGLPGLNGFIGEFLILLGAFQRLWGTGVFGTVAVIGATSGIVLGAAYMLWLFQRVMFGPLDNPENQKLRDINLREFATLAPIIILCFWIGLRPNTFTRYMDAAVDDLVYRVDPELAMRERARMAQLDAGTPTGPAHAQPAAEGHAAHGGQMSQGAGAE